MSEEILKALMQLFALITKQDGGIGQKETDYVKRFLEQVAGLIPTVGSIVKSASSVASLLGLG